MVLSLPAVALVLLTKAELFVATCLIAFGFVSILRRCWKDMRYDILGDARYLSEVWRNVSFHLGIVFLCGVYWVVLDLFDSSMPFRLVSWSVV